MRNKTGDSIASAVTNLDLHDIARASRTYGIRSFYVVTPLKDQQDLTKRIVSHWTEGFGGIYNPDRREALGLIRVKDSISDVVSEIAAQTLQTPRIVATCARPKPDNIDFPNLRKQLIDGAPYLLLFGTAWGLAETVIEGADYVLEPIFGTGEYNHLSVRSAVAIVLDRLLERK